MNSGSTAHRIDLDRLLGALLEVGIVDDAARLNGLSYAPIGIGHTADTFKVELEWDDPATQPRSLIAKIPSLDAQSSQTASALGAYEREAMFYERLAPRTDVSVPRYYGVIEYNGQRSGLLLEDLSGKAEPGDQFVSADPTVIAKVRTQLAALQAPFWNDDTTGQEEWLHRRLGVPIPSIMERMERSWSTACDDLAKDFATDERDMIDRFVAGAAGWAEALDGPFSITHHDFRIDNFLFSDDAVYLLDWQTAGWGVPMFDLAYLHGTSFDTSVRRDVEKDQVRQHVEDLAAHGVDWTFEDAWLRYRQASLAVLLMLVPPTGSVKRTERGDDMFRRLLSLGARMALDLDADEFLPKA